MATLLLSAVGTAVGGPLGGAIGALAGSEVDRAIIGSPHREGPRLKELGVTTSSYGTPIARLHGRMRAPGSIIWATDLAESSESTGGKGQPSVTTYSYSVSFAVALSSRPILRLGRIWADGNLLRGAAGDLKVGGTMRLYDGHGDHPPDPLIASDKGADCPAFRHTAYAVFEDLQLADFGNRIPALTFEVIADEGEVALADLVAPLPEPTTASRGLDGLQGFSLEGGPLSDALATLDAAWPIALDAGAHGLAFLPADAVPEAPPVLPEPAAAKDADSFGQRDGTMHTRAAGSREIPDALRYYDVARDFQSGLQRADGRARPGRSRTVELPGALAAEDARALVNAAAERAGWARDSLAWRVAELDPALAPGAVVRVPGKAGLWRITGWEWRDQGVELDLLRLPRGPARRPAADPGEVASPPDLLAAPTLLEAFELPWDGTGSGSSRTIFAAPSSAGAGWSGAALYAAHNEELVPLGGSGSHRCIIGHSVTQLGPSPALLLERGAMIEIDLVSPDFALAASTAAGLARGANRVLLGNEVIQFAHAEPLGDARWRLVGLLRGRGGTEGAALAGHPPGTPFILLDGAPLALDPSRIGPAEGLEIAAIGLGDSTPVSAAVANPGLTLRPLTPVHPVASSGRDGRLALRWTRRARGAWAWPDGVEIPLVEQAEAYRVGLGPVDLPFAYWDVFVPELLLDARTVASLASAHPGARLWVRQVGSFAQSDALLLATLS